MTTFRNSFPNPDITGDYVVNRDILQTNVNSSCGVTRLQDEQIASFVEIAAKARKNETALSDDEDYWRKRLPKRDCVSIVSSPLQSP